MTITLETIISEACSRFDALPPNNTGRKGFTIPDGKEAKLVFDVLMAHGFDAKLYPENENNVSRLYVSSQKMPSSHQYMEALAYARHMRSLKQSMDALCADSSIQLSDYSVSFSLSPNMGKQIAIHLAPATLQNLSPAPMGATTQAGIASSPLSGPTRRTASGDDFFAGPQVTRPVGRIQVQDTSPDNYWKQVKLYMKGNALFAIMMTVIGLMILIGLFSMFVVSKGFLCPDFASYRDKNPPWYCGQKPQ